MNVIPSAAAVLKKEKQQPNSAATASSRLNFYQTTPQFELSLDEFEVYALKRLKVLRKIEQLKTMRSTTQVGGAAIFAQKLDECLATEDLLHDNNNNNNGIDEASHFILRLSYCATEDLRRWFLQHETALFQHRLKKIIALASSSNSSSSLFQQGDENDSFCQMTPIDEATKARLADDLQTLLVNPTEFHSTAFYAVPFAQALDLVATRQCILEKGLAYVPAAKIQTILVQKFRAHLSKCLVALANHKSTTSATDPESARINPLLDNMSRVLVHQEPNEAGLDGQSELTAANVVSYKSNMPLCMRQLQTGLQQDKKLKHWGRLQYGLFLKGAGLSLEDALAFFQRHFECVTGEQFQKQYAYNIRHMYGKEGKRATYTPYNCTKIILGNAAPASDDHHGCPYKHYDVDALSSLLSSLHIGSNASDRQAILQLKREHQYQLACQKHFQVQHPGAANMEGVVSLDNVGNHPNAWFRASVAYKNAKANSANNSNDTETAAASTAAPADVSP